MKTDTVNNLIKGGGDVPRSSSQGVYISQLIRLRESVLTFARVCSYDDELQLQKPNFDYISY